VTVAPTRFDRTMTAPVCPRDEGDNVMSSTYVDKAPIVGDPAVQTTTRQSRLVDREPPELVDTNRSAALLRPLDIEPAGHGTVSPRRRSEVEQ